MAKKKPLPPRQKRMDRPARLHSARHWIPTYNGKDLVRGYAKWFAVDSLCAIIELRILGVPISDEQEQQARIVLEVKAAQAQKRKEKRMQEENDFLESDSDDLFEFIAGYTPGGAPYGVKWDD